MRKNRYYDVAAYIWPSYRHEPRLAHFWPEKDGEWYTVRRGSPRFPGHDMPCIPLLGHQNEADPKVMRQHVELALAHGLNVFIMDWYWVSGTAIDYSTVATNGVTGMLYACALGNPGVLPAGVSNNIALIQRGTPAFAQKAANAKVKGAKAVVIYNNVLGSFVGTFLAPGDWLPLLAVSDADGATLLALAGNPATVTVYGSKVDADIDAPEAWDVSTGSTNIIVAVIDTGLDYNHPDLRTNMWVAYAGAGLAVNLLVDAKATLAHVWVPGVFTNSVSALNTSGETNIVFATPGANFFRIRLLER